MDRILRSCLWSLALTWVPGVLSAQMAASALDSVVLSPGDAVQITVFRKGELSGEFTISANGTVDHPLYQKVLVAGVPLSTARERLDDFLRGWEAEPFFLVKPLFRVAVGGEVMKPDLYTFAPEITIAQAVATAGGVTSRGRLDGVRVLRDGAEYLVDLGEPRSDGLHMTVRSGDQIMVQRTGMQALRDYIAPISSLVVATVSLITVIIR